MQITITQYLGQKRWIGLLLVTVVPALATAFFAGLPELDNSASGVSFCGVKKSRLPSVLRMAAEGKSPLEQVADFQRGISRFQTRTVTEAYQKAQDELIRPTTNIPKFTEYPVKKNVRAILALDGGGVRGLVTAYVLKAIETEIQKQKNDTSLKIGEVFDVVAGTSTGSLLATYFTGYCLYDSCTIPGTDITLDGTADNAIKMYRHFAKEIFPEESHWFPLVNERKVWNNKPLHKDEGLNRVLDEAFGHLTLQDLATKRLPQVNGEDHNVASLFVFAYDMVYRRPVVFHADRDYYRARFVAADPFSQPYEEGGFPLQVNKAEAKRRSAEMNKAYEKYKNDHKDSVLFRKDHVGDAQIPLHPKLSKHARYSRSLAPLDGNDIPEVPMSKVCRCSVAAPGYLYPGCIDEFYEKGGNPEPLVCCDGGVVANAPAQACFSAVYFSASAEFSNATKGRSLTRRTNRESTAARVEDFASHMVLSIGCGQLGKEADASKVKFAGLWDYLHPKSEIGNVVEVLMSTSSQISHVGLEALFASQNKCENYLRIQLSANRDGEPGGITNPDVIEALKELDNSSDTALDIYEAVGDFLIAMNKADIEQFVHDMLQTNKIRAK